jgi:hypothetical protein
MNFEVADLLDQVDQWKLKLHEELKGLTTEQRAAFWRRTLDQAHALGLPRAKISVQRKAKRGPRATG